MAIVCPWCCISGWSPNLAHGGSGTRLKGGPQDVVQDSKFLERERHQIKTYFNTITSKIKDADALVIFGPAETGEKFSKFLHEHYNELSTKLKGVRKADSMTNNQVKAWVRDFFTWINRLTVLLNSSN